MKSVEERRREVAMGEGEMHECETVHREQERWYYTLKDCTEVRMSSELLGREGG